MATWVGRSRHHLVA